MREPRSPTRSPDVNTPTLASTSLVEKIQAARRCTRPEDHKRKAPAQISGSGVSSLLQWIVIPLLTMW